MQASFDFTFDNYVTNFTFQSSNKVNLGDASSIYRIGAINISGLHFITLSKTNDKQNTYS